MSTKLIFAGLLVMVVGCGGNGKVVAKISPEGSNDSVLIRMSGATLGQLYAVTSFYGRPGSIKEVIDSAAFYEFNNLDTKTFRQYSNIGNITRDTMADIVDSNWNDCAIKIHGKWHVFNDSAAIETLIGIIKNYEKRLHYK